MRDDDRKSNLAVEDMLNEDMEEDEEGGEDDMSDLDDDSYGEEEQEDDLNGEFSD